MTPADRVRELCITRRCPMSRLEKDLGYSNGYIRTIKKLPYDRLTAIADYFEVPVDYLMHGEKNKPVSSGDELIEILEACKERSDLRMLFKLSVDATPDDVRKAIAIIQALKGDS